MVRVNASSHSQCRRDVGQLTLLFSKNVAACETGVDRGCGGDCGGGGGLVWTGHGEVPEAQRPQVKTSERQNRQEGAPVGVEGAQAQGRLLAGRRYADWACWGLFSPLNADWRRARPGPNGNKGPLS